MLLNWQPTCPGHGAKTSRKGVFATADGHGTLWSASQPQDRAIQTRQRALHKNSRSRPGEQAASQAPTCSAFSVSCRLSCRRCICSAAAACSASDTGMLTWGGARSARCRPRPGEAEDDAVHDLSPDGPGPAPGAPAPAPAAPRPRPEAVPTGRPVSPGCALGPEPEVGRVCVSNRMMFEV